MANDAWQQWLTNQHAAQAPNVEKDAPLHCYPLPDDGLIAVHGEDAVSFLQGQLTNDIKQVDQQAQLTGYCTAKGRLLALFYAFKHQDVIYLQCPRALVAAMVKRLRMFVLRSKVTLTDVSEDFVSLGLASTDADVFSAWPTALHHTQPLEDGVIIRVQALGEIHRARLICPVASAQKIITSLSHAPSIEDALRWERLEIEAGIPQVYPATQEQFVPQMLNLDQLNGINFKKGCYTGQEIVARTHYLGKVKRRTGLAQLTFAATNDSSQLPTPAIGDVILDAQQQEAGQIVRLAPTDKGYLLLVEYRLEAKEAGLVTWQSQPLAWLPMPYSMDA